MALDQFNEEALRSGGAFVKLEKRGDHIKGLLVDIEIRDRTTPKGDVVLSGRTKKARKVYIVHFLVDPDPNDEKDDGRRRFQANESGQQAIRETLQEVGGFEPGGMFTLGIKTEKTDEYSQHEYLCRYESPTLEGRAKVAALSTAVAADVDPFAGTDEAPF